MVLLWAKYQRKGRNRMKASWKARCCCLAIAMALAAGQSLPVYAAGQALPTTEVVQPEEEEAASSSAPEATAPPEEPAEDGTDENTPPRTLRARRRLILLRNRRKHLRKNLARSPAKARRRNRRSLRRKNPRYRNLRKNRRRRKTPNLRRKLPNPPPRKTLHPRPRRSNRRRLLAKRCRWKGRAQSLLPTRFGPMTFRRRLNPPMKKSEIRGKMAWSRPTGTMCGWILLRRILPRPTGK